MSEPAELATAEKEHRAAGQALLGLLGAVTVEKQADETMIARPLDRKGWTFGTVFADLPEWRFRREKGAPRVDGFSKLRFSDVLFRIGPATEPRLTFEGQVTQSALVAALPELALLGWNIDSKELIRFTGDVEPRSGDFPLVSLSAPAIEPATVAGQLRIEEIVMEVASQGAKAENDGLLDLVLNGRASNAAKAPLGAATTWPTAGGWYLVTEVEEPGEAIKLPEAAGLLALSVRDVSAEPALFGELSKLGTPSPLEKIKFYGLALSMIRRDLSDRWSASYVSVTLGSDATAVLRNESPKVVLGEPTITIEGATVSGIGGLTARIGGDLKLSSASDKILTLDLSASLTVAQPKPWLQARLRVPRPADGKPTDANSLANAIAIFGGEAPDSLKGLFFERLSVDIDTRRWSFEFETRVEGGLKLPLDALEFSGGEFMFRRDDSGWGARLSGEFALMAAKTGSLERERVMLVALTGEYAKGETFRLGGEMKPLQKNKPVPIEALVRVFDSKARVPAVLKSIFITKLRAEVDLGEGGGWCFDGGLRWQVPLNDADASAGKLTIDANLSFKKRVATEENPATLEWKVDGTLKLERLKLTLGYENKPKSQQVALTLALGDPKNPTVFKGDWNRKAAKKAEGKEAAAGSPADQAVSAPASGGPPPAAGETDAPTGPTVTDIVTLKYDGNVSIAEILGGLYTLVTDKTLTLSAPWDCLQTMKIDKPKLEIDLTNKTAKLSADAKGWKIEFQSIVLAELTRISLSYGSKGGKDGLSLALDGTFMGQAYGEATGNAIAWDVIGDAAPPVLPGSSKLLDLRYLAVGQHVGVRDLQTKSVSQAITVLREDMKPPTAGSTAAAPAMRFDSESGLIVGVDFTYDDMLTISALYQDPAFAGIAIQMAGKKAGRLAGLSFELIYRRIGDVGLYSVTFQPPDSFRHQDLGAVELGIGVIGVDIYTNSDFKLDLGFPANLDFSRSFAVTTPTLAGEGGLYFSKRSGSVAGAAMRGSAPGKFDPIIAAGIGLSIGTVKKAKWGPVSASISLKLTVVLEGAYAFWSEGPPGREVATEARYFRFVGIAQISGSVRGVVDLKLISAAISVDAVARVTIVMESYEPTKIRAQFHVSVRASVKVVWTVHLSFDMDLDTDVSFGERLPAPWGQISHGPPAAQTPPAIAAQQTAEPSSTPTSAPARPKTLQTSASKPLLTLHLAPVPSRRRGPVAAETEWAVEKGFMPWQPTFSDPSDSVEVLNVLLSLPLAGDAGLSRVIGEVVEEAACRLARAEFADLRAQLTYLAEHLWSADVENRISPNEAVDLLASRFEVAIVQKSTDRPNEAHTLFPLPPQLKPRFYRRLYGSDRSGDHTEVAYRAYVRSETKCARDAMEIGGDLFRDYTLTLLRTACQAMVRHWDALARQAGGAPTIASLATGLGDLKLKSGMTALEQVAGTAGSLLMSGTQIDGEPLSAALRLQTPLVGFNQNWTPGLGQFILNGPGDIDLRLQCSPDSLFPRGLEANFTFSYLAQIRHFMPAHDGAWGVRAGPAQARLRGGMVWSLPSRLAWTETGPEPLGPVPNASEAPFIRMFTPSLVSAVDLIAGYEARLRPDKAGEPPVRDVRFSTLVPLQVRRADSVRTLSLRGADARERDRLLSLWRDLRDPSGPAMALTLLWSRPDSAGGAPTFHSELLDPVGTRIIQSSLTTTTVGDQVRSSAEITGAMQADRAAEASVVTAALGQPAAFVRFLWQASITGGEYVLNWMAATDHGWPEGLFGQADTATIWLLAVPRGGEADSIIRSYNNAAIALEQRDAGATLVVESESPTAPKWDMPVLAPGEFGLSVRRHDPTDKMDANRPAFADIAQSLFNILRVRMTSGIDEGTTYRSPSLIPVSQGGDWIYSLKLHPNDLKVDPERDAKLLAGELPEDGSPYRGILLGRRPVFEIEFLDGFGNPWPGRFESSAPELKYVDDVLGPSRWPGFEALYQIEPGANGKAKLSVDCRFVNAALVSEDSRRAAMEVWRNVAYQLMDPEVEISLRSSINTGHGDARVESRLDRLKLLNFARHVHWLLCGVTPLTEVVLRGSKVSSGQAAAPKALWTLGEAAAAGGPLPVILQLPAAVRFLTAKLDQPLDTIFDEAGGIGLPVYQPEGQPQSPYDLFGSIPYRVHLPLPPGLKLAMDGLVAATPQTRSLRDMAEALRLSVAEFLEAYAHSHITFQGSVAVDGLVKSIDGMHITWVLSELFGANYPVSGPGYRELLEKLAKLLEPQRLPTRWTSSSLVIKTPFVTRPGDTLAGLLKGLLANPFAPPGGEDPAIAVYHRTGGQHPTDPTTIRGVQSAPVSAASLRAVLAQHKTTLADFAAVNLDRTLGPGVTLPGVRAVPDNPSPERMTRRVLSLARLTEGTGAGPVDLAEINADLAGAPGREITLPGGNKFSGGALTTWKQLVWFCKEVYGIETTVAELAALNKGEYGFEDPLLLPPKPLRFSYEFTPSTAEPITPLDVQMVIRRPAARVSPDWPAAGEAVSDLAPALSVQSADQSLSKFTEGFEKALPGFKLAVGYQADGRQRMFVVDRKRIGLDSLKIGAPDRHALPPLKGGYRPLAASVRELDQGTGRQLARCWDMPIDAADLRTSMRHMFGAIEKVLSPELAGRAHDYGADALETMVTAKWTFAAKLAADLAPTSPADAGKGAPHLVVEAYRQALRRNLNLAFGLDSVWRLPVSLQSAWPAEQDALLAPEPGEVHGAGGAAGERISLWTLADRLAVGSTALAHVLADVDGILDVGQTASYRERRLKIEPRHTLRSLLAELGAPTPEMITGAEFPKDEGLFKPGAGLPITIEPVTLTKMESLAQLAARIGLSSGQMVLNLRPLEGVFGNPADGDKLSDGLVGVAEGGRKRRSPTEMLGTIVIPSEPPEGRNLATWHQANPRFRSIFAFADRMRDAPLGLDSTVNVVRRTAMTVESVATWLGVRPVVALRLLADVPGILFPDGEVSWAELDWRARTGLPHGRPPTVRLTVDMTLAVLAQRLGFSAFDAFVAELATSPSSMPFGETRGVLNLRGGLFAAGVPLPVIRKRLDTVGRQGPMPLVDAADTLGIRSDLLEMQLAVDGVLRGQDAVGVGVNTEVIVPVRRAPRLVGQLVAQAPGPLGVAQPPEVLGVMKIPAAGAAEVAVPIDKAALARVPPGARLGALIDQVEYDIAPVEGTGGFEASHWLRLLKPELALAPFAPAAAIPAATPLPIAAEDQAATNDAYDGGERTWEMVSTFTFRPSGGERYEIAHLANEALLPVRAQALDAMGEWLSLRGEIDGLLAAMAAPAETGTRTSDLFLTAARLTHAAAEHWEQLRQAGTGATKASLLIDTGAARGSVINQADVTWAAPFEAARACRAETRLLPDGDWEPLAQFDAEASSRTVSVNWREGQTRALRLWLPRVAGGDIADVTATLNGWRRSLDSGVDARFAPGLGPEAFESPARSSLLKSDLTLDRSKPPFERLAQLIETARQGVSASSPHELEIFVDLITTPCVTGAATIRTQVVHALVPAAQAARIAAAGLGLQGCAAERESDLVCTVRVWSKYREDDAAPITEYRDIPL